MRASINNIKKDIMELIKMIRIVNELKNKSQLSFDVAAAIVENEIELCSIVRKLKTSELSYECSMNGAVVKKLGLTTVELNSKKACSNSEREFIITDIEDESYVKYLNALKKEIMSKYEE